MVSEAVRNLEIWIYSPSGTSILWREGKMKTLIKCVLMAGSCAFIFGCVTSEDSKINAKYLEGLWEYEYDGKRNLEEFTIDPGDLKGSQYFGECESAQDTCGPLLYDVFELKENTFYYHQAFGAGDYFAGIDWISDNEMEVNYTESKRKTKLHYHRASGYKRIADNGDERFIKDK
jgi:hypothetical protein